MNEESRASLDRAQEDATEARNTIVDTSRTAIRNYLRAAFTLQRAGLETLEALQKSSEELTFTMLDRAEEVQGRAVQEAENQIRENIERLRDARERVQDRFNSERDELEESGAKTEGRLRDSAEIAIKVARVLETRIETMLTELIDLGRREMSEIEERIDAMVERLDSELEEQVHPIVNYDEKNAEEVINSLKGLDEMQLRTVRAYEVNNKNRVTVLRAIDEKLADLQEAAERVTA